MQKSCCIHGSIIPWDGLAQQLCQFQANKCNISYTWPLPMTLPFAHLKELTLTDARLIFGHNTLLLMYEVEVSSNLMNRLEARKNPRPMSSFGIRHNCGMVVFNVIFAFFATTLPQNLKITQAIPSSAIDKNRWLGPGKAASDHVSMQRTRLHCRDWN